MSAFWKYFAETLRWPQLFAPGPLQALTRGLTGHFDATRDDALYLREQFFPAKAEDAILPGHGDSRGITRHPSETDAQFRARVTHAWRWHNLGGKTLGLPEILAHYGIVVDAITNRRELNPWRWAEFEVRLAETDSPAGMVELLEQMPLLVWVLNEYKPARSILARVYNHSYDERYWVWSVRSQWGRHIWSDETGIRDPETGLVVSLGQKASAFAGPLSPFVLALRSELSGSLARLTRHWIWAYARWSESFPVPHGIASGQISGVEVLRVEAPFAFRSRRLARGQIGWSYANLQGQPTPALHLANQSDYADRGKAQWADVNARWGLGRYILTDTPLRWGTSRWGDCTGRREVVPLERFTAVQRALAPYLGTPVAGSVTLSGCGHTAELYPDNHWRGLWDTRKWNPYFIPTKSTPQRKVGLFWGETVWGNAVWQ